jgi:protein TonB
MSRYLICLGFVIVTFAAEQSSIAQSEPKAFAYFAPRPDYRPLPNGQRPEGSGVFTVNINSKTGLVTSVSVKKSTGWAVLDKAAIDALRRWKFKTPTKSSVEVPIDFTAHGASH